MKERKLILEIAVTAGFSLLLGFLLAAGAELNGDGYLGYGAEHAALDAHIDWLSWQFYLSMLLFTVVIFAVLMLLWRGLDWISLIRAKHILKKSTPGPGEPIAGISGPIGAFSLKKHWLWLAAAGLFCCWIPIWLALWPGVFTYDAQIQYEMLLNSDLQTQYPPLHTLLLGGLVYFCATFLGGANIGVILYTFIGLLAAAVTFAWMLYTMAEEGAGKVLLIGSFVFLAINPVLVSWLVSTSSDVLFTLFCLLAALFLYRISRFRQWELLLQKPLPEDPQDETQASPQVAKFDQTLRIATETGLILFGIVFAVLAFKNSALYSLIIFLPFAAFLIRKHLRLRVVGIMAASVAAFAVLYVVFVQIIFQLPTGSWQAMDDLSIPRQQLARVWVQTEDPAEIAAFEQVFSPEELASLSLYEADNANATRAAFQVPFEDNFAGLWDLYLSMGMSHPTVYFDAVLLTNYEAWYPGAVVDGQVAEESFAKLGEARASYLDTTSYPPATSAWIIEGLGTWLTEMGVGAGSDWAPVRLLSSPATYLWLLLIVLARTICTRNRRGTLACVFLLIFALTALLYPFVTVSAYLVLIAAVPLLLHIASSPSWKVSRE